MWEIDEINGNVIASAFWNHHRNILWQIFAHLCQWHTYTQNQPTDKQTHKQKRTDTFALRFCSVVCLSKSICMFHKIGNAGVRRITTVSYNCREMWFFQQQKPQKKNILMEQLTKTPLFYFHFVHCVNYSKLAHF